MKSSHHIGRRRFLRDSALSLGVGRLVRGSAQPQRGVADLRGFDPPAFAREARDLRMQVAFGPTDTVWIMREPESGFEQRLASLELARGLRNLGLRRELVEALPNEGEPPTSVLAFSFSVDKKDFKDDQAYEIVYEAGSRKAPRVRFTGGSSQAILYSVFDFLERQGAFFGLDGEVYPLEAARSLVLPPAGQSWRSHPRFKVRGLVPWPDFLNCVTVYNREDWRAYLESMLRMRFNTLGVHVYSGPDQWAESFLSFEYAGVGHLAHTDTTASNRWGYIPERTSRYGMGAANFFAHEVFGSEATTEARNCWEDQAFAQRLWREAFEYAQRLGIKTGVGFEPYQIPDEIYRATPPESHYVSKNPEIPGPRVDPESVAARDILEARLGRLLEAYPTLDYVWLWEDEGMSWASQKGNVPFSVTPFQQAHDFLRRHAPKKRLVVSGWGGVTRHFARFHKALPEDVIFASLNDNLGWDPVSEEFAKLDGRERWPIPWLEDDPSMWLPQFHVHRFVRDMDLTEKYGCQGLLGIHWRHRIVNAGAGFLSRYSWDTELTPAAFYRTFASAQAREPRAQKLAQVLNDTDLNRLILCSSTGKMVDGHHQVHEFSGDYDEGFTFWNDYDPPQATLESQARVAHELRTLADAASSPTERERLNYLARFVEFLSPYSQSWILAHSLHQKLEHARQLKTAGKADEATRLIRAEGVPLWLRLAPLVRETLLTFQEIVSTRPDLGQLASMHNKYERLALFRLRASMKEHLGELPPEVEDLWQSTRQPDDKSPLRAFIPTCPTLLREGESVRILAVAPAPAPVERMHLLTRSGREPSWRRVPMDLVGRKTYQAILQAPKGSATFLDYYVSAEIRRASGESVQVTAPLEAPARFYTATLA